MSRDHDFICDFIEIYKLHPCLWDKTDPHYHNSNIREAAYTLLLEKYREYDDKATKATVKSKINSLRSTYKKEYKKVKDSEKSGAGNEEIYKPSLWYYDLLSFINDQQPTRTSVNTMNCEDEDKHQEAVSTIIIIIHLNLLSRINIFHIFNLHCYVTLLLYLNIVYLNHKKIIRNMFFVLSHLAIQLVLHLQNIPQTYFDNI